LFEQISKVMSDIQLSLEFQERSACLPKELAKFSPREATLTFGNVGRNRNSCPAHLRGQPEAFGSWKDLSFGINQFGQDFRFLPSNEVAICSTQSHLNPYSIHQLSEFLGFRIQKCVAFPDLEHGYKVLALRNLETLKP